MADPERGNSKVVDINKAKERQFRNAVAQTMVTEINTIDLAIKILSEELRSVVSKYKIAKINYKNIKELTEVIDNCKSLAKSFSALRKIIKP